MPQMSTSLDWSYYPKSARPGNLALAVVRAFEKAHDAIHSGANKLKSDEVLALVAPHLIEIGFRVEAGKGRGSGIRVPVLFGRRGRVEKSFDADAYHEQEGFVVEVEAGRGVTNYQFLKDLFEACTMHGVETLAIAVRQDYLGHDDFDSVCTFFDTLYASARLQLPLRGLLVIGY